LQNHSKILKCKKMKKLPIGIQSFEVIRTEDYYYVDKTRFIEKLVS